MTGRDYVGASYGGPKSKGRSAARLARYIEDRQKEDGRYEKAATFGDRAEFVAAARERAEAGRRASYTHLVISPERGERFTDEDFEKLIPEFTRDRQGRQCAHFAAIHRDSEHAHLHVGVARDKYQKAELEQLKERARDLIARRERLRAEPWRDQAQEREERALSQEPKREPERELRRDDGRRVSIGQEQELER